MKKEWKWKENKVDRGVRRGVEMVPTKRLQWNTVEGEVKKESLRGSWGV